MTTIDKTHNGLNDIILNTSMVIESIVKGKSAKMDKIDLLIERLQNTVTDLVIIKRLIKKELENNNNVRR